MLIKVKYSIERNGEGFRFQQIIKPKIVEIEAVYSSLDNKFTGDYNFLINKKIYATFGPDRLKEFQDGLDHLFHGGRLIINEKKSIIRI